MRRKLLAALAIGARLVHVITGFVRVGNTVDGVRGSVACDIVMFGDDEVRRREKGSADEDDGSETHLVPSFAGLGWSISDGFARADLGFDLDNK